MNQRERLVAFQQRWSEFLDVVEDASRYGTNPVLEDRFARLRVWLQVHYRGVKGDIGAELIDDGRSWMWQGGRLDVMEEIFLVPTLDGLVRHSGGVLGNLVKVREVIDVKVGSVVRA